MNSPAIKVNGEVERPIKIKPTGMMMIATRITALVPYEWTNRPASCAPMSAPIVLANKIKPSCPLFNPLASRISGMRATQAIETTPIKKKVAQSPLRARVAMVIKSVLIR